MSFNSDVASACQALKMFKDNEAKAFARFWENKNKSGPTAEAPLNDLAKFYNSATLPMHAYWQKLLATKAANKSSLTTEQQQWVQTYVQLVATRSSICDSQDVFAFCGSFPAPHSFFARAEYQRVTGQILKVALKVALKVNTSIL